MIELRGKAVADAHKAVLSERLAELQAKGIVLGLGILLVGDDKAAQMYARFMEKTAKSAGFGVEVAHLSADASQAEVLAVVKRWNEDDRIYGVLPLMPMPPQVDPDVIIESLDPGKDIDGLTARNIGLASSGKGGFWPCTPLACMAILEHYKIPLAGKHVVVVGRSQVVGKPVALLLLDQHATVTLCHSKTTNLEEHLKQADVVVAAVGRAHVITGDMLKPGATVIDVGINDLDGKTVGDVEYASAIEVAGAVTPVPGGVGSVTTTMLLENIYEAYHARNVNR